MIKELTVKNLRSIAEASLSFEKSGIEYRQNNIAQSGLVNPAVIYGDNGSGKSILLSCFKYLTLVMNYGEQDLNTVDINPDYILLDDPKRNVAPAPSISVSFLLSDGAEFVYSISGFMNVILRETLIVSGFNNGEPIVWRSDNRFRIFDEEGENEISSSYSAIRKIGNEEYGADRKTRNLIRKCYETMCGLIFAKCNASNADVYGKAALSLSPRDLVLDDTYEISKLLTEMSGLPTFDFEARPDVSGSQTIWMKFEKGSIPYLLASDGIKSETKILMAFALAKLNKESVVVIDEINASIHSMNVKKMVDLFQREGIQLICSSHDTNLLRYLRPDQVYFATYGKDLHSSFKRLSDIHPNIREINNIEAMYRKRVFDSEIDDG